MEELLRKMRAGKAPEPREVKEEGGEQASAPASKARLVVRVPADARLWVDRVECPISGTVRSFETPDLNPQQNYNYTLRVAVQRDGRSRLEADEVQHRALAEQRLSGDAGGELERAHGVEVYELRLHSERIMVET